MIGLNIIIPENFSSQVSAEWKNNCITISGIKDGNWESLELDDHFLEDRKTKKLLNLMKSNYGRIYNYSIKGKDAASDLSIADVLRIFSKYKGKNLTRYKGLGQMDPEDLRDTCMDGHKQRLSQITVKDTEVAFTKLALWHSSKQSAREGRRAFMLSYVPDLKELNT